MNHVAAGSQTTAITHPALRVLCIKTRVKDRIGAIRPFNGTVQMDVLTVKVLRSSQSQYSAFLSLSELAQQRRAFRKPNA